jgi:hypothetical protein
MNRRRRRIALAVAFVAGWAVLAVSCGSSEVTREEYGSELRGAMGDLEEAWGDTSGAVGPSAENARASTEQTVDDLRRSQLALRDAGNRLDSITPPQDLADDHDALVAGVRDMADAVDLLVDAQLAAESDPERAKELAREFATDESFGSVEAAAARIKQAGVDAGL